MFRIVMPVWWMHSTRTSLYNTLKADISTTTQTTSLWIIDVHSALASIDYRLKWKVFAILIWMLLTWNWKLNVLNGSWSHSLKIKQSLSFKDSLLHYLVFVGYIVCPWENIKKYVKYWKLLKQTRVKKSQKLAIDFENLFVWARLFFEELSFKK